MTYDEQDINVTFLVQILKSAFFNVYDINDEGFKIKVDQFQINVVFDVENKRIKFSSIDVVHDYKLVLFKSLLLAVNNANEHFVNVTSYIVHYEDKIYLRVDQYISYSGGLIMEQFVELLRLFDKISVAVFQKYILPIVENKS